MNKSMLSGIVVGVVVATAGGAIASYTLLGDKNPGHADVIAVERVTETVSQPREVCEQVAVIRQKPVRDKHRVTGTVAGAVIGGALGNQIGGGSGKQIATAAGAVAGGYAGNKTQEHLQTNNTYRDYENQCRTVTDSSEVFRGYDVTYRIGDREETVRMDEDPGERIRLENGQPVLN